MPNSFRSPMAFAAIFFACVLASVLDADPITVCYEEVTETPWKPKKWTWWPSSRGRSLRKTNLDVEGLESRIALSGNSLLSRTTLPAIELAKPAKTPKLTNPALYASMAQALYKNRTPAYVPAAEKKAAVRSIEEALSSARVPVVAAGHFKVIPAYLYEYDDGDVLLGWQFNVNPPRAHDVYSVQILVSPSGVVTNTYVGKTNPQSVSLTPPVEPFDAARFTGNLTAEFSSDNLNFGPIDPTTFGAQVYSMLVEAGMGTEAFDAHVNLSAGLGENGNELTFVSTVTLNLSQSTTFAAILNANGTYTIQVESTPAFLPVPDPESLFTPGVTSIFIGK